MRFLILDTDYPAFLDWLYANNPSLEKKSFTEQQRVHAEACFGVAGFCANNLRSLGHDAQDLHVNNEIMQKQWALEHGLKVSSDWRWDFRLRRGMVPWVSRVRLRRWFEEILAAQIRDYKPDVLLNQAVNSLSGHFIKEMKPYIRFVIGQHAATTLSDTEDYSGYDLMISSFPPTIDWCHRRGIRSFQSRLGFEPKILSYIKSPAKKFDLTFSGNMLAVHRSRQVWLEELCRHFPQLKVWTPAREQIPQTSVLQNHYAGSVWGHDMYHVLCSSKIVLNHHGDVPPYANNMRLFEATGVGTCLLTDWKPNLGELFDVGKELLAYRSLDECVELIRYYLTHDEEREAIARAGQERTLREHTYFHRMQELVGIVERYLGDPVAMMQRAVV